MSWEPREEMVSLGATGAILCLYMATWPPSPTNTVVSGNTVSSGASVATLRSTRAPGDPHPTVPLSREPGCHAVPLWTAFPTPALDMKVPETPTWLLKICGGVARFSDVSLLSRSGGLVAKALAGTEAVQAQFLALLYSS